MVNTLVGLSTASLTIIGLRLGKVARRGAELTAASKGGRLVLWKGLGAVSSAAVHTSGAENIRPEIGMS